MVIFETMLRCVFLVLDVFSQGTGGPDCILAGNDCNGSCIVGSRIDTLCDDWCDELEDVGAD